MADVDPTGTVSAALAHELAPGVLRAAAALPSGGARAGDLIPVAGWIGGRIGARRVVLRLAGTADGAPVEFTWTAPEPPTRGGPPSDQPDTAGDDEVSTFPIHHHGTEVGALIVTLTPPAQPAVIGPAWPHDPRPALVDAARVLGVVIAGAAAQHRARRARRRGQDTLARIADTRQRAASMMESERHALERDLHDGVQLHLVSLQLAAAVVEHRLDTATADEHTLTDALADLGTRLDRTHRLLIDTAAGIIPGPLRAEGLAAGLAAGFSDARDVTLDIAPAVRTRRYPPIIESTVYFTCLEAVNNALKHAPGAPVTVTVRDTYQGLWFEVADTGPGLDPTSKHGLARLRARLAAIGAAPQVTSAPGQGTRITATIPI